jgi:hypothetical protein
MCTDPARTALFFVVLLYGGLTATPAFAQQAGQLYQVEVVIFSQPAGTSAERPPRQPLPAEEPTTERMPAPATEPSPEASAEAGPGAEDLAELDPTLSLLPEGFSVPKLPLILEAVARRLNTGGYRLLWHQAWIQPPLAREGPHLVLLAALGQGPATPGLEGTMSLVAGRFLHLGVDLTLSSASGLEAELRQRRRLRPRVQQYFDHPRIGIVAVVTPVEIGADQSIP